MGHATLPIGITADDFNLPNDASYTAGPIFERYFGLKEIMRDES